MKRECGANPQQPPLLLEGPALYQRQKSKIRFLLFVTGDIWEDESRRKELKPGDLP